MDVLERILDGRQSPSRLPISLLRYITAGFSDDRKIGGKVYKGILGDKTVAVKRFFKSNTIDDSMFDREITAMMTFEHRNIVRLLCYSYTEEVVEEEGKFIVGQRQEWLLCFEYISNGNLGTYVTDELRGLDWHTRYQIIQGICEGLQHLHKEKKIIHMTLKPSNILFDDDMVPKITDFGLSRFEDESRTIRQPNYILYCALEYLLEPRTSAKSDIYSLGFVIRDLVTGSSAKPCINSVLRKWRHRWNKSAKYKPLWHQQVTKCLELAFRCTDKDPTKRPHIWDIIQELNLLTCAKDDESADQLINSCLDDMIGIEPLEVNFPVEHLTEKSCSIQLNNNTDHYIAFMTFRDEGRSLLYSVQPDKGVVPPGSMCSVTITLLAQCIGIRRTKWTEDLTVRSIRGTGTSQPRL